MHAFTRTNQSQAEHENKQKGNKFSIYIELHSFNSDFSDKKVRKAFTWRKHDNGNPTEC